MLRPLLNIALALLLTSCVSQQQTHIPARDTQVASIPTDAERCLVALRSPPTATADRLDNRRISLLNWNTQKNTGADFKADLDRFADGADLILLQEAVHDSPALAAFEQDFHWSFAPGYQRGNLSTGVMTASRVKPLTHCSLSNNEPWLGSPKATNVTQYALSGSDETLLVVNVHLINFTYGLEQMQQQLLEALSLIEKHQGPVIVAGDFNTWRGARQSLVVEALSAHGLQAVSYSQDRRKRFFGYALDHTFVRGVQVAQGTSHSVDSSDHNPISVDLEI